MRRGGGHFLYRGSGRGGRSAHFLACSLKNFTISSGASSGYLCVPGWTSVTRGVPAFDGYCVPTSLPALAQGSPAAAQPLTCLTAAMVRCWFS